MVDGSQATKKKEPLVCGSLCEKKKAWKEGGRSNKGGGGGGEKKPDGGAIKRGKAREPENRCGGQVRKKVTDVNSGKKKRSPFVRMKGTTSQPKVRRHRGLQGKQPNRLV